MAFLGCHGLFETILNQMYDQTRRKTAMVDVDRPKTREVVRKDSFEFTDTVDRTDAKVRQETEISVNQSKTIASLINYSQAMTCTF